MNEATLRAGLFAGVPVHVGLARGDEAARFVPASGEAALLEGAAPRRQADFARGRLAARAALARAGVVRAPILADADRVPIWPAGFVGSIAHTGDLAVAAVARECDVGALGVDVEVAVPLDRDLWEQVLAPPELATIMALPTAERGWGALRHFCAKEAAYKAGFPARRRIIEFGAMAVTFAGETFSARWEDGGAATLVGRCARYADDAADVAWQFAAAWQLAGQ